MKKNVLIIFFLLTAEFANAQTKFCFVDTDYILKHIPEYKAAQLQLDDLSAQWQKEVDAKYVEIEKLYKSYQAEQVLLADDLRKKREDEIVDKEKQVKEFQKSKFGYQGELSKQREELITVTNRNKRNKQVIEEELLAMTVREWRMLHPAGVSLACSTGTKKSNSRY